MTIKSAYRIGGEVINVIVNGEDLIFLDSNGTLTTINGLRISKGGVIREFPDLEDNSNWKEIALERLKGHLKNQKTDMDKTNYIKDELTKFGYEPMFYQRAGFRPKRFK